MLDLNSELYSVGADVLSVAGAALLWSRGVAAANTPALWTAQLPAIADNVAAQHGRGLSRELLGPLRSVLAEYPLEQAGRLV